MHSCIKNSFLFRSIGRYKAIVLILAIAICISFSSSALANDISLNVDGYQQTKQGTYAYKTCGAACSLMVLNYSNCSTVSNTNDEIYYTEYMGENRSFENICTQINKLLGGNPYSIYWNCSSVSDLENRVKNSLSLNRPLIVSLNSSYADYAKCSGIYNKIDPAGHYIVISGIYTSDNQIYFKVKDPMCSAGTTVHVPSSTLYAAMPYSGNGNQHPIMCGITSNAQISYSTVSYENCTYKIIKDTTLRKEPFDSAEKGSFLSSGATVTSVALADNGTNYWLKLTTGEYIFSGYNNQGVQTGNQYLQFVRDNSGCTSSSGWNLPSGNLPLGKGFELKGDFNYSSSIQSIEAEVYKIGDTTPTKESIGKTSNKTTRYYSIYSSTVNTGLPFSQLTAGDYRIDIKVNYYYDRGKIGAKVINSSTFSIGSSGSTVSTLQFTGVLYPKIFKINTSAGWVLGSGTLASNYELKTLTTKIVNSSGTVISSGAVSISGYSYEIKKLDTYSASDNGVKFSKITSAGSYKWILTATDSAGRSLTLEMPFTASSTGSTLLSTASATYQEKKAYLNINGWLNGAASDTLEDYGTCDVYINGSQVADDVNDYNVQWPVGTSYEIKDIRANISFGYNGVYSSSLSGTVKDGSNNVVLNFSRPGRTTVRVIPGTDATETVFNWDAVDTATGYVFRILKSDGYEVFFPDTVGSDQLTYSKLLPAGKYWVTVAASNSNNNSWLYSAKVSFIVTEAPVPIFDSDFVLPSAMMIIDAKAFEGISAMSVKLSEATTTINSKAFANCPNLVQIYIPRTTSSIASDAFLGVKELIIYGYKGSYAENYAQEKGFTFVPVKQ